MERDDGRDVKRTRREWLVTGARTLLLGGAAGLFVQQLRRGGRPAGSPTCPEPPTCRGCLELDSGCRLPKATAFRATDRTRTEPWARRAE